MIRALFMKRLLWPGEVDGPVALGKRWKIYRGANGHVEKERDGDGVAA